MEIVGQVESLWRYPVKSMRGESLPELHAGAGGLLGDRVYAFHSSAARHDFPYLTGREQPLMLRCHPSYRPRDVNVAPPARTAAEGLASLTPLDGTAAHSGVDVQLPSGEVLAIDDPRLIAVLAGGLREGLRLSLLRSDRAMADCHPVSIISIQTARQLSTEVGTPIDKRRFRANVYVDLASTGGFGENAWVGRRLRIGETVHLAVLERDRRCKMITLDPDTAEANPQVMRAVSDRHDGTAGIYATVLVEGLIRAGDPVVLLEA